MPMIAHPNAECNPPLGCIKDVLIVTSHRRVRSPAIRYQAARIQRGGPLPYALAWWEVRDGRAKSPTDQVSNSGTERAILATVNGHHERRSYLPFRGRHVTGPSLKSG